ncbi:hypothetical protein WBG78_03280 [Chryseolinea sp. T2]|uniref:hypothetical protein n=1 Tax=Chryseolinea sp. T2 TaxID=3129255 RepID=UPI003077EDBF
MKTPTAILLLIVISTISYGQGDVATTMLPELQWNTGNIVLNDGSQLTGKLKYNDRVGLLAFEDGAGDSRSLTARTISTFEYFDEKINRRRTFYSIEYGDPERQGNKRPFLFELLKEFDDYALLSRFDPMDVRQVVAPVSFNSMPATSSPRTIIDLAETVYILTPEGDMEPIFRLSEFITDGGVFDSERKKRKIIDKLLLPYFIDEAYFRMMDYVDEKELDIWEKEDFITALSYYKDTVTKMDAEASASGH